MTARIELLRTCGVCQVKRLTNPADHQTHLLARLSRLPNTVLILQSAEAPGDGLHLALGFIFPDSIRTVNSRLLPVAPSGVYSADVEHNDIFLARQDFCFQPFRPAR